jgi:hypothetical protein
LTQHCQRAACKQCWRQGKSATSMSCCCQHSILLSAAAHAVCCMTKHV